MAPMTRSNTPITERIKTDIRLPRWIVIWLDARANLTGLTRTALIETALRERYKLKEPK